jgi:hypothetical protein
MVPMVMFETIWHMTPYFCSFKIIKYWNHPTMKKISNRKKAKNTTHTSIMYDQMILKNQIQQCINIVTGYSVTTFTGHKQRWTLLIPLKRTKCQTWCFWLILLSRFMCGNGKCKLPSKPTSTGFSSNV